MLTDVLDMGNLPPWDVTIQKQIVNLLVKTGRNGGTINVCSTFANMC